MRKDVLDKIQVTVGRDIMKKKFLRYRQKSIFAGNFSRHSILGLKKFRLSPSWATEYTAILSIDKLISLENAKVEKC
jgi:hypothetical protein